MIFGNVGMESQGVSRENLQIGSMTGTTLIGHDKQSYNPHSLALFHLRRTHF